MKDRSAKRLEVNITDEDRGMARKVFASNFQNPKTDKDIFYEICFCICAPQTTFKNNIKVIDELRRIDYYHFSFGNPLYLEGGEHEFLWKIVKPVRFYRNKTKWLVEARQNFPKILSILRDPMMSYLASFKRDWLVKNVKGLGMKASSHLLRNLGAWNLAIIDTHILKFLGVNGKWKYNELEDRLKEIAKKESLSVAELDIIIWKYYSKTPWEDYRY